MDLQPSKRWARTGEFKDDKEALNISGIACGDRDGERWHGLLIGDEKRYARLFELEDDTIRLGGEVRLLPKEEGGKPVGESDGEGIDYEGGWYYLVGSHGLSKNDAAKQPSRYSTFRFPAENGKTPTGEVERSARLEAIIFGTGRLGKYAGVPLQENGVNIEGLAVRGTDLHVGFRSPTEEGTAFVLRVGVEAVFGGAPSDAEVLELELRRGSGIRDMAKVAGGFLVLSGQSLPAAKEQVETAPAELWFWNGKNGGTVPLGQLAGVETGGKPEALLVLEETDTAYRVLILCDGVKGGDPKEYLVPKRR